jgi:hypothetical protein
MTATADDQRVLVPVICGNARFGSTLAVDGPYLVVGASARDSTEGIVAACLYDHASWQLIAALANTHTGQYAGFADVVALSARLGMVAINSPGDDPVHVFERSTGWGERLIAKPEDSKHDETSWADALAFVGNDLAVGSALSERVFVFPNARGTPLVLRPSVASGDFGRVLAADRELLAVGAPDDSTGRVYVYHRNGGRFALLTQLTAPVPEIRAEFGAALAVSGKLIAVGSPRAPDGALQGVGKVDLFERRGGAVAHVATVTSPDPRLDGWFGASIACDGRRLAVGEPGGPGRRGRVWRFDLVSGTFRSLGLWEPRDLVDDEWFGSSVALGPHWLAAGAPSRTAPQRFGRVVIRDWPSPVRKTKALGFRCRCGSRRGDPHGPSPHEGFLRWRSNIEDWKARAWPKVEAYLAAVDAGDGQQWLNDNGHPATEGHGYSRTEIIDLLLDTQDVDSQYVWSCPACQRIFIGTVDVNKVRCFVLEEPSVLEAEIHYEYDEK